MTNLGEALALVLYCGAARADATPDQLAKLRATIPPAMAAYRINGDEEPIRSAVRDALGVEWEPSGVWADQLARLAYPGGEA